MGSTMKLFILAACVIALVAGHGALVSPRSRNSVDYLVGVNNGRCANLTGEACNNGQAAFWYSQGCFIGCPECFHNDGRRQADLCGLGVKATLNDPKYRTVNRDAPAGSPTDIYKHNPWRYPGSAPVGDKKNNAACGYAGGTPNKMNVSEEGIYTPTKYASHGDLGINLKPLDTNTTWKIGGEAEVTWQVKNNHGGGYQYRLCPVGEPLTEACFQKHPLDFVQDRQAVVFPNGTLFPVKGVFVSGDLVKPAGSTWAAMPMPPTWLGPRCLPGPNDTAATPNHCESWEDRNVAGECKPCPQTPGSDCSRCDDNNNPSFPPPCEGCQGVDWNGNAVFDVLKVPASYPPGKYILGWRYDCE